MTFRNKNNPENLGKYWGGSVFVYDCLLDRKRTLAFKKAIYRIVRPRDIVIDAGSGTGILAMFAADAGARTVYAIEDDLDVLKGLEKTIEVNGYQDKIRIIKGNALRYRASEKADILISEIIGTGLIEEDQVSVFNYLRKFLRPKAKVIPQRIDSFVELIFSSRKHYGKEFFFPYYLDPETHTPAFSNTVKYLSVKFDPTKPLKQKFQANVQLQIKQGGKVNGLKITSKTFFPDDSTFTFSPAYCLPLIFPLKPIRVKPGQTYTIKLNYKLSGGIGGVRYCLEKK